MISRANHSVCSGLRETVNPYSWTVGLGIAQHEPLFGRRRGELKGAAQRSLWLSATPDLDHARTVTRPLLKAHPQHLSPRSHG